MTLIPIHERLRNATGVPSSNDQIAAYRLSWALEGDQKAFSITPERLSPYFAEGAVAMNALAAFLGRDPAAQPCALNQSVRAALREVQDPENPTEFGRLALEMADGTRGAARTKALDIAQAYSAQSTYAAGVFGTDAAYESEWPGPTPWTLIVQ